MRQLCRDPSDAGPLYQQVYADLRAAILAGKLGHGKKLPSTRALAKEMNISRNTVLNAYRQLLAEGYLVSVAGSGTYVAQVLPEALLQPPASDEHGGAGLTALQPRLAENARRQIAVSRGIPETADTSRRLPRPFTPEAPALDAFPHALWTRIVVRQARRMPINLFAYQGWAGFRPLREAIAAHVAVSRQVHCSPEQILILPGSQGALDLAARMLVEAGDPVWMEDPGYPGALGALLGAGAQIVPVPIDGEGLMVEAGLAQAPAARLVYLTPSHQFPLGVTMSPARRLALLDWAKRSGAYILEDDYDSEYRFAERPLAALQRLDDAERVIYIGTFSKVLFPALRLGYMILPPSLVEPFTAVRRFVDIHPPVLEQAALAEFISDGHFARHLRRMRSLYAERRSALLRAAEALPLELFAPEAGIHCVGWLPDGMDAEALVRAAAAYDLDLTSVARFCIRPLKRQGLLLGYGGYEAAEIQAGMQRLARAIQAVNSGSG